MRVRLMRLLDIRSDEVQPVLLMLVQSFFTGIFLAYLFSVANGAFLKTFEARFFPVAYIISGVLGFVISSIFSYFQRTVPYKKLLPRVLMLLLVVVLLFTLGMHLFSSPSVLVFLIFVLLAPIYMIMALQFWNLAMQLFDIGQSKRLFGLLGTGDVLSSLLGFLSVPTILDLFSMWKSGELALLSLGSIGLFLGLLVQLYIFKVYANTLGSTHISTRKKPQYKQTSKLFKTPYFRLILALTCLSVMGQYFVDFNFMNIAQDTFDKANLTAFIGRFFALIKGVELLSKTFVSNRLMKHYGLRVSLLVLPVLLLVFTLFFIAVRLFAMDSSYYYMLIPLAMNKLFDRSLRKAIDEPSIKLLYQPLPENIKYLFQTRAEGQAKQLGIIAAGVLLIIISLFPSNDITIASFLLLILLSGWIFCGYTLYYSYRETIRSRLLEDTSTLEITPPISIWWLKKKLSEASQTELILPSMKLLESVEPYSSNNYWKDYLRNGHEDVRTIVLCILKKNLALEMLSELNDLRKKELTAEEHEQVEEVWQDLSHFQSLHEEMISHIARSKHWSERILAAYWLKYFEHSQKAVLLRDLIIDTHPRVIRVAVEASASIKSLEHWSLIVELVEKPQYSAFVIPALVTRGIDLLPLLEKVLMTSDIEECSFMRIIQVVARMEGKEATQFLAKKLPIARQNIKIEMIKILAVRGHKAKGIMREDIKNELRKTSSYLAWVLSSILELREEEECQELVALLKEEVKSIQDDVFFILVLLYDSDAIWKIREYLSMENKELVSLSLEMMDLLLEEDIKPLMIAWIGKSSISEQEQALSNHFPHPRYTSPRKRLCDIIYQDFSRVGKWIRVTAILILGKIDPKELSEEVEALAHHEDAFLKETALVYIQKINPDRYRELLSLESKREQLKYNKITGHQYHGALNSSRYDKILKMRQHPFFEGLSPDIIVSLSDLATFSTLLAGKPLEVNMPKSELVYFIMSGSVWVKNADKENRVQEGSIIGLLEGKPIRSEEVIAAEEGYIIYMSKPLFYGLAQLHVELLSTIYYFITHTKEQSDKRYEEYDAPVWSSELG